MIPRRKLLTVIVREVPPPTPLPGQRVTVILNGKDEIEGRVYQALGFGILRVEIRGEIGA